jgi:hypothetical protein
MKRHETEIAGGWGQEGGVDTAAELLRRYDPAARSWNLPRTGEFWDAVRSAHELGRFGDGHTIAVVDDGFDLSIPALAEQTLMCNVNDTAPSVHGTVVALLLLAVAPNARLMLYPTAVRDRLDPAAIQRALREVDTTSATIVNLSLGDPFPTHSVFAVEDYLCRLAPWPEMSEADVPFWISQGLGELGGWRDLLRPPQSIFEAPIAALERSGRTVVAATGNARGHIYDPAFRASVFSVSFHRVERSIDLLMEEAVSKAPTFSQSEFTDFAIIQPPGVLGSSFATPQISGFAALMASRGDLRAYAEVAHLAGMAEGLMVRRGHGPDTWSDRRDGVIDKLFLKAVRASPHSHSDQSRRSLCPECALFAASAFINYGLFKLNWGDLDGAEALLGPAEAFASANPHAAANLGMVYAMRAQRAQNAGDLEEVSQLLKAAARLQQKASQLRPEHEPYRRRVEEFMIGAQHPHEWEMAP